MQRPVYESTLDLDLTLDALRGDALNTSHLYAVKLNLSMAENMHISAKVNGHTKCSGVTPVQTANKSPPAKVNGHYSETTAAKQLSTTKSKLSEEKLRETFGHFGTVERIFLPAKPGKHTRHALISE